MPVSPKKLTASCSQRFSQTHLVFSKYSRAPWRSAFVSNGSTKPSKTSSCKCRFTFPTQGPGSSPNSAVKSFPETRISVSRPAVAFSSLLARCSILCRVRCLMLSATLEQSALANWIIATPNGPASYARRRTAASLQLSSYEIDLICRRTRSAMELRRSVANEKRLSILIASSSPTRSCP